MSDFGIRLKRIRLEKGMTLDEFAEFLGTSKQNLSRYELGEVTPKITTFAKIAEKLGMSLTELHGDKESEPAPKNEPEHEELIRLFESLPQETREQILGLLRTLVASHTDRPSHTDPAD